MSSSYSASVIGHSGSHTFERPSLEIAAQRTLDALTVLTARAESARFKIALERMAWDLRAALEQSKTQGGFSPPECLQQPTEARADPADSASPNLTAGGAS